MARHAGDDNGHGSGGRLVGEPLGLSQQTQRACSVALARWLSWGQAAGSSPAVTVSASLLVMHTFELIWHVLSTKARRWLTEHVRKGCGAWSMSTCPSWWRGLVSREGRTTWPTAEPTSVTQWISPHTSSARASQPLAEKVPAGSLAGAVLRVHCISCAAGRVCVADGQADRLAIGSHDAGTDIDCRCGPVAAAANPSAMALPGYRG